MSRNVWVCDDPPADEPEEFEWMEYAAEEFASAAKVSRQYRDKGWATPISGDATTIRRKFAWLK